MGERKIWGASLSLTWLYFVAVLGLVVGGFALCVGLCSGGFVLALSGGFFCLVVTGVVYVTARTPSVVVIEGDVVRVYSPFGFLRRVPYLEVCRSEVPMEPPAWIPARVSARRFHGLRRGVVRRG